MAIESPKYGNLKRQNRNERQKQQLMRKIVIFGSEITILRPKSTDFTSTYIPDLNLFSKSKLH